MLFFGGLQVATSVCVACNCYLAVFLAVTGRRGVVRGVVRRVTRCVALAALCKRVLYN